MVGCHLSTTNLLDNDTIILCPIRQGPIYADVKRVKWLFTAGSLQFRTKAKDGRASRHSRDSSLTLKHPLPQTELRFILKELSNAMEQSRPATARGISFSVESLISKPDQNGDSPANSARAPGLPINFSVERLLDKQDVRGGEAVKGTESSIDLAGEGKDTNERMEWTEDFPWMHSTRYDPPPRKFKIYVVLLLAFSHLIL